MPSTISSTKYTTCPDYILGGLGVLGTTTSQSGSYFSRVYNNLPIPHSLIYFSFDLYAIDGWVPSTDAFAVQIDLYQFADWNTLTSTTFPSNQCGSITNDLTNLKIVGKFAHTASFVTFRVISKLSQPSTNRAIGIRNVKLLIVKASSSPPTAPNICAKPSTSQQKSALSAGACDTYCTALNQYGTTNLCSSCDPSCSTGTCFGSGTDKCYACASGYSFDGTNCIQCAVNCEACDGTGSDQCTACKTGYILFNKKTCELLASCVSPLVKSADNYYCNSPCDPLEHVYLNGSCSVDCPAPYTSAVLLGTINKCYNPCSGSTQALYWDGQCDLASLCVSPLTPRSVGSENFCDFKCNDYEYLYWNGTCSTACEPPLTADTTATQFHSRKQCKYVCSGSGPGPNFLYWNGACETCNYPLAQRTEGGKGFCDFPCPEEKFLYWNRTCSFFCPAPLEQGSIYGRPLCNYKCGAGQYLKFDSTCVNECKVPFVIRTEAGKDYCDPICPVPQYLLQDGSCIATCDPPLRIHTNSTGIYCLLPCDTRDEYYYPETKECSTQCNTPPILESGLYYICIPIKPILETVQLVKLYHYLPYLKIELPRKLQNMTVSRGVNLMSIRMDPSILHSLRTKLPSATLSSSPIVQTSFYLTISTSTLLFILIIQPIKKKIDQANLIVVEAIVFAVNVSAFILTILYLCDIDLYGAHTFFSDVIIAGNFSINFLAGIFLPLKIFAGIRSALFIRKHHSSEELGAWIQLLFIPIQQGGLGFEQVELVTAFTISRIKSHNNKVHPQIETELEPTLNSLQTTVHLTRGPSMSSDQTMLEAYSQDSLRPSSSQIIGKVSSPYKQRKTARGSARPEGNFEVIEEEYKEEEGHVFTARIRELSNSGRSLEGVNGRRTDKKKNLELSSSSQRFDVNGLDLNQMTPFNVYNTPS